MLPHTQNRNHLEFRNPISGKIERVKIEPNKLSQAESSMRARMLEIVDAITKRLAREPTHSELLRGYVHNTHDTRTVSQMQDDDAFEVKLRTTISPEEQQAQDAENKLEKAREEEAISKMSRDERLAYFTRDRADRIVAESENKTSERDHLKKFGSKIGYLEQLIREENWNANSDAGYRALLKNTLASLNEPNGCPTQRNQMLKKVDARLKANQEAKLKELANKQVELNQQVAANSVEIEVLAEEEANVPN